ncbi:DUF1799 domain-containing protein [Enterobacter hormaechei]|nr:DUF1799 domain-containing protein [Enterobacter hormaechei]
MIAVASAFYTPEPTAADLAPYGLTPDDYDDQYIDVWPDVWPSFLVFQAVSTQWRTGRPASMYPISPMRSWRRLKIPRYLRI